MVVQFWSTTIVLLRQALILDPGFVAAHVGMTAVYQEGGFTEGVREFTESGYAETKKRFKKWPSSLTWGDIDSRQYLRAVCNKAALHHIDGENEQADKLYRLLLKQTPNDNQGVRYLLAGMHAGMGPDEVNAMFDAGNRQQDWSALENMLDEQNAKYHFWHVPKS